MTSPNHNPVTRSRTRTRTRIRTRRLSPCYRHPDEPVTGICAACLRERLSGLDPSTTTAAATLSPDLRRCRSVSASKCEASGSFPEPRRRSCDDRSGRRSLSLLFDADDVTNVPSGAAVAAVESKNLECSVIKDDQNREKVRVLERDALVNGVDIDDDEEGESKTMKEYIDLEIEKNNRKSKDLKEIAGNFWGLGKKLLKWRHKNKVKKLTNSYNAAKSISSGDSSNNLFHESSEKQSVIGGRRSCDVESRISVDGGRISFDQPRASWDGYMIARTIPRLAPLFSGVESGILGNVNRFENQRLSVDGPMHSIMEDETSSGGSGHSNSDSSFSMRGGSSFDRSSSVRSFGKKTIGSEDHSENVKLVITERELKDWHLNSTRDDSLEKFAQVQKNAAAFENLGAINVPKKSVKWPKVRHVFGLRHKNGESRCEGVEGNVIDNTVDDNYEKQGKESGEQVKEVGEWKLTRSGGVVSSRNSHESTMNYGRRSVDNCQEYFRESTAVSHGRRSVDNYSRFSYKDREDFVLEMNKNAKCPSTDFDNGTMPFYMTPLRSLRRSKSGKFKLQKSLLFRENVPQLN